MLLNFNENENITKSISWLFVTREHSLPSAQTFVYVRNERQLSKETEVRTPGADNSIFIYIYSMLYLVK